MPVDKIERLTRLYKLILSTLYPSSHLNDDEDYFIMLRYRLIQLIEFGVIEEPISLLMMGYLESLKDHWVKNSCYAVKEKDGNPLKAIIMYRISNLDKKERGITDFIINEETGFPYKFNIFFKFKESEDGDNVRFKFWKQGRLKKVEITLPTLNVDNQLKMRWDNLININSISYKAEYKGFYFYNVIDVEEIIKDLYNKKKVREELFFLTNIQIDLDTISKEFIKKIEQLALITEDDIWKRWLLKFSSRNINNNNNVIKNFIEYAICLYRIIKIFCEDIEWIGFCMQPTHLKTIKQNKITTYYETTNLETVIWGKKETKVDEEMLAYFLSLHTHVDAIYDWVEKGIQEMRYHSHHSAISAIMSRNMSHHIGSHVISRSTFDAFRERLKELKI